MGTFTFTLYIYYITKNQANAKGTCDSSARMQTNLSSLILAIDIRYDDDNVS